MKIMQSTVERSLYVLLVLVFIINIATTYEVLKVQTNQNQKHSETNATLEQIQKEMLCIGVFFDQPGAFRAKSSISALKACQPIVKEVK